MTIYTQAELEPRIYRLAKVNLRKISAKYDMTPFERGMMLERCCQPWALAKICRWLWAHGHDIEDFPCPCSAYRLTRGRVTIQ